MRNVGTVVRGIRAPIVKEGDDLERIVVDSVLKVAESDNIIFKDKDIVSITESLVARAQGNYVTIDHIAKDIQEKFNGEVGVVFPIFSRNRFSLILKGIARGAKKVYLLLNTEIDEVGNPIVNPFTNIDIVKYYKELSNNIEIILSDDPTEILKYTKNVLVADIHKRKKTKEKIKNAGCNTIYSLDEIVNKSIDGSGYNEDYGLLGSNYSTDEQLKLFPRDGQIFVNKIRDELKNKTGKNIEVMIYGDGAFKDPVAGIWEFADPVVSPAYTEGLAGTPNELKLKFLADDKSLTKEELMRKIKEKDITAKEALGTTPRRLTDLIGSLCDLTSGSGDKGTPIILIQGYFDNYSAEE